MTFHTFLFLLIFLPIIVILFYLIRKNDSTSRAFFTKAYLIGISVLFAFSAGVLCISVLLISMLFSYAIGRKTERNIIVFCIGVGFEILLLFCFKIYQGGVFAPLGLSFYVFSQIAYLCDVYHGKKRLSFVDYAVSVLFFAKLAEGPMVNPVKFIEDNDLTNDSKNLKWNYFNKGMVFLVLGLCKKLFIADFIGRFANTGFGLTKLNFMDAWLSSISYTMELYFDFSGYCDMAIGIALLLSIKLPINFNSPYKAVDFNDFWKRWHITLTTFLTNYLYFPLGGNRKGKYRTYINIMIVFIVSGLWHGIGLTFLIWGALHGISLIICKIYKDPISKIPSYIRRVITFFLVNLYWVFFRADSVRDALAVIRGMFDFRSVTDKISPDFMITLKKTYPTGNTISAILLILSVFIAFFTQNTSEIVKNWKRTVPRAILVAMLFVLCLYMISVNNATSSLYFNF